MTTPSLLTVPELVLTRGLPASGKTTWARTWAAATGAVRVSRDDLRQMITGTGGGLLAPWQEHIVTCAEEATVRAALTSARTVVVDAMHLNPRYIHHWQHLAHTLHATVRIIDFPIDPDLAITRDAARAHPVGATVIHHLAARYTTGGTPHPLTPAPPTGPTTPQPPGTHRHATDTAPDTASTRAPVPAETTPPAGPTLERTPRP